MATFRAILFDLDGTLLDTLEDLTNSMNSVLRREGFPEHRQDAYRYFVGEGMLNLVKRALPEDRRDSGTVAKCLQAVREEYRNHWADTTRPYFGVPKTLNWLDDHGVKKAILSNKGAEITTSAVERFLPYWDFTVVRGAVEGIPLKPDPTAALAVAQEMSMDPSDFCYLGDTATDMQTAVAAGMYPVGATWGFREARELQDSGAKTLLERPAELAEFLGN
jgi:phosphoglycolate phosphatase